MPKSDNNINVGKIGEDLACDFLIEKRYRILFRNYRERFDEIDIIAKSFDRVLVFVEVKTLKTGSSKNLIPEDNLTKNKFRKINRACRLFAGFHNEFIDEDGGWRIDLIAVTLNKDGGNEISHYENITAQ
jgi:putative endonuclease